MKNSNEKTELEKETKQGSQEIIRKARLKRLEQSVIDKHAAKSIKKAKENLSDLDVDGFVELVVKETKLEEAKHIKRLNQMKPLKKLEYLEKMLRLKEIKQIEKTLKYKYLDVSMQKHEKKPLIKREANQIYIEERIGKILKKGEIIHNMGVVKHFSPSTKEWSNSIYMFNQESTKGIMNKHEATLRIIKSYFNLYSKKLDRNINYIRSRRYRARTSKVSLNRILTGRLEAKHTNDIVTVQLYIYNTIKNSYKNILRRLGTFNNTHRLSKKSTSNSYVTSNIVKGLGLFIHKGVLKFSKKGNLISQYNKAFIYIINRMNERLKLSKNNKKLISKKTLKLYLLINLVKKYENLIKSKAKAKLIKTDKATEDYLGYIGEEYIAKVIKIILKKEYTSVYYKQLMSLNKMKFQKRYIMSLQDQVKRIYNKTIHFNFVNLKYLHMDSDLLSGALITKLRKKKTSVYYRLRDALNMFKVPTIDRERYYEEKYTRKVVTLNASVKRLSNLTERKRRYRDNIDYSINKFLPNMSATLLKKSYMQRYSHVLQNFIYNLKYKLVKGIRFELSGRLTRRYTAARSLHKLRYKGNIRNTVSSDQRLSTIMLRGHAKSNLQYNFSKGKRRIGAFGVKTWVSGV